MLEEIQLSPTDLQLYQSFLPKTGQLFASKTNKGWITLARDRVLGEALLNCLPLETMHQEKKGGVMRIRVIILSVDHLTAVVGEDLIIQSAVARTKEC